MTVRPEAAGVGIENGRIADGRKDMRRVRVS